MEVKTVGVVGAGLMGTGIAQAMVMGGCEVVINDASEAARGAARKKLRNGLIGAARLGLIGESGVSEALSRLRFAGNLMELTAASDFIVEAVPEDLELKRRVFAELEKTASDETILTSNTSSLTPDDIAVGIRRPERFLITHFFNPPYLIPLVEIVPAKDTGRDVVRETVDFLESLGNAPVVLKKAVPGFLINRLQIALLREAVSLVQKGVASFEEIDRAVRSSIGRRLSVAGVFEVCDLAGLDVVAAAAETVLDDLDCTRELPDLIRRRKENGHLGVKTGQGFYTWDSESIQRKQARIAAALAVIRGFDGAE